MTSNSVQYTVTPVISPADLREIRMWCIEQAIRNSDALNNTAWIIAAAEAIKDWVLRTD